MMSVNHLSFLNKIGKGKKFIFFGDTNQLRAVDPFQVDYIRSPFFMKIVEKCKIKLLYDEKTSRYDKKTIEILNYLLKNN